jgi:hypothetical protein
VTAVLRQLLAHMESLPADYAGFSMRNWVDNDALDPEEYARCETNLCGTVACLAGHGPDAGICFTPEEIIHHYNGAFPDWDNYSLRLVEGDTALWQWLFAFGWTDVDDTLQGAIKRLRYALDGKPIPAGMGDIFYNITEQDKELYS